MKKFTLKYPTNLFSRTAQPDASGGHGENLEMSTYTQEELNEILRLHNLYLENDPEGVRADLEDADLENADLSNADLRRADLRFADLKNADLSNANLRYANLKGSNLSYADLSNANLEKANLDYSCWPLWCGSFEVKVDLRIASQLAYHFCRLDYDDPEYILTRNAIVPFANKFHRVNELGKLENKE